MDARSDSRSAFALWYRHGVLLVAVQRAYRLNVYRKRYQRVGAWLGVLACHLLPWHERGVPWQLRRKEYTYGKLDCNDLLCRRRSGHGVCRAFAQYAAHSHLLRRDYGYRLRAWLSFPRQNAYALVQGQ